MERLRGRLREFARERDWEKFHTPKNLAMALAVEVAEVLELFQWATPDESERLPEGRREALREEIGDVLIYLAALADRVGIDPVEAAHAKVAANEIRYPARRVRGSSRKYTEYPGGEPGEAGGETV
jgi:NTP pyrophosphatase (non-canonical NTP hydrolase)